MGSSPWVQYYTSGQIITTSLFSLTLIIVRIREIIPFYGPLQFQVCEI